eukprot:CAMPEP_0116004790 /NCGR_PEP_ID=MMETSP0321-20121206/799_1 /TAXON_ID=163516 /ORGANISM="Leptocylindrus danicus var. danicus, Strain B650" /LENGTH=793 /DNA_ID=CAMNT_0003473133 /DNA_START=24 /DNA_END=2405 /DNA_ORIENTATION=+
MNVSQGVTWSILIALSLVKSPGGVESFVIPPTTFQDARIAAPNSSRSSSCHRSLQEPRVRFSSDENDEISPTTSPPPPEEKRHHRNKSKGNDDNQPLISTHGRQQQQQQQQQHTRHAAIDLAHSVDSAGKEFVSDLRKDLMSRLTMFTPPPTGELSHDNKGAVVASGERKQVDNNSGSAHRLSLDDRKNMLVSRTKEWKRLQKHAKDEIEKMHLRDLMMEEERCDTMCAEWDGVYLDYSRQRADLKTMKLLRELADRQDLKGKIQQMVSGEKINFTEDRSVLHTALRADKSSIGSIVVDGQDCVEDVHKTLDQVRQFTDAIRNGDIRGYTGKRLRNFISVGIGGSYLGPEFLYECLKTEPDGINSALGYNLRFLSNVDPVDIERTCADLDPEETLIIVVSKTFTTAETMLNARTMRQWLWDFMGNDKEVVRKHVVACSSISATDKVEEFGINTDDYFFKFWDWVGGRYSVCSAVGAVPISLQYGFDLFEKFLEGARSIDKHFVSAPFEQNIPVIMGLLGVWNHSFMNYNTRTTLPYAEALLKLPAHIQQLDMESNGKRVTKHGVEVDYNVGEVDFGEAGTNGQHSFYQLLHQGQTVPCDFIGFIASQHDLCMDGEDMTSHDELMSNFFAQPDALANGKTADEVRAEGVKEDLVIHRTFHGNRPSLSLILPKLTAYAAGQLLSIYEHRTAVQGFIWDINSFDQYGVELGKKLANEIKDHVHNARKNQSEDVDGPNPSTTRLLKYYLTKTKENESACSDERSILSLSSVTRKTYKDHFPPTPPESHDLGGPLGKM